MVKCLQANASFSTVYKMNFPFTSIFSHTIKNCNFTNFKEKTFRFVELTKFCGENVKIMK